MSSEGFQLEYLSTLKFCDDNFVYKGQEYPYYDINNIHFKAVATRHSINLIPTGTTYECTLVLGFKDGKKLSIERESGLLSHRSKNKFEAILRASEIFSDITFTQRVQPYEDSIEEKGFFKWNDYQIGKNGDLFKNNILLFNLHDKNISATLDTFSLQITKKPEGFAAKLAHAFVGKNYIIDLTDNKDCFLYIFKNYLGLSWSRERVRVKKLGAGSNAFREAVITLAAQLCKIDGQVTKEEIQVFKKHFGMNDHTMPHAGTLFNKVVSENKTYPEIAAQIYASFEHSAEVLEYIVIGLLQIAAADGHIDNKEGDFIREICRHFRFSSSDIEQVFSLFRDTSSNRTGNSGRYRQQTTPTEDYKILGISPQATWDDIKAAYRDMARKHHPDLLRAKGISGDELKIAEDVLKSVNAAFERISAVRKAA